MLSETECTLENIFTAAGCSAEPGVLDVGPDGLLAYASGPNVLLHRPTGTTLLLSLDGDSSTGGPVHAVRILSAQGCSRYIVAANGNGSIVWWDAQGSFLGSAVVSDVSVNYLACLTLKGPHDEFLLCFSDTQGRIYRSTLSELSHCSSSLRAPYVGVDKGLGRKVISLALQQLDEDIVLIFAGLSDNKLVVIHDSRMVLALAGHTNWINSMDAVRGTDQSLCILTGSSDRTIRVWRLAAKQHRDVERMGLLELVPSQNGFSIGTASYAVTCESILYGHEGMIRSVRWASPALDSTASRPMRIISASADGTIILWWESPSAGWMSETRVGTISGINTSGGFFSGILTGDKEGTLRIVGHVASGSIMQWTREADNPLALFRPSTPVETGHLLEIKSCDWSLDGDYLLTAGLDRTTRIWAPDCRERWREIARPQIHGYELAMVRALADARFLSAGDEKILRAFVAPRSFRRRIASLRDHRDKPEDHRHPSHDDDEGPRVTLPALGLSTKMIDNDEQAVPQKSRQQPEMPLSQPPSETDLIQHTLWLETDKLYGHGLELFSFAISHSGRLAASSSKATTSEDAVIRLWSRHDDEGNWKLLPGTITAHSLTVVSLAFSPDDKYLLAASRDRHWSLTRIEDDPAHPRVETVHEAHNRIIWCVAWSADGQSFVTGSRDRTLKTWVRSTKDNTWIEHAAARQTFEHAVTAVAVARSLGLLALGLEDGTLCVYRTSGGLEPKLLCRHKAHSSAVNEIRWHPARPLLASVSDTLQIHSFTPLCQ